MIILNEVSNIDGMGLYLNNNKLQITKSISTPILLQQNLDIVVEENCNVKLVEILKNETIKLQVKKGAYVQYQTLNSSDVNRIFEVIGSLDFMQISLAPTTEKLSVYLQEEQASINISLLSISSHEEQKFFQSIYHQAKETFSNVSNFGVAMFGAKISFETTGKIENKMSKSVCKQLSKGIIMDDNSWITSKPILMIDEYDVSANHGASIGKMSDESMFYLMSRGLTKVEAFLLILEGIIHPFIVEILDDTMKENISNEVKALIKR